MCLDRRPSQFQYIIGLWTNADQYLKTLREVIVQRDYSNPKVIKWLSVWPGILTKWLKMQEIYKLWLIQSSAAFWGECLANPGVCTFGWWKIRPRSHRWFLLSLSSPLLSPSALLLILLFIVAHLSLLSPPLSTLLLLLSYSFSN